MVIKLRVPQNLWNSLTDWGTLRLERKSWKGELLVKIIMTYWQWDLTVLQGILDILDKAGTHNAMKENKIIRISKQSSPVQIMQNQQ